MQPAYDDEDRRNSNKITWEGWRGGVLPLPFGHRLAENSTNQLAAALAAAIGCAELFAWHAKDHPMAGKRHAGLSLWRPGADWPALRERLVHKWAAIDRLVP